MNPKKNLNNPVYTKMIRYLIQLLIIISVLSCSSKRTIKSYPQDPKLVVLTNPTDVKLISNNDLGHWSPNNEVFIQIESIIQTAINNGEFNFLKEPEIESIYEYYKQYICYFNENNDKLVYVNAFYENHKEIQNIDGIAKHKPFDWKNKLLIVHSQHTFYYWNMRINMSTSNYEM